MAHRYNSNRKTLVFSVGDVVSLRIPRIDRTSSDQPYLPCVVAEVKGKAQNLTLFIAHTLNVLHVHYVLNFTPLACVLLIMI